jgi:alkanesulfonate monooxygenase SsuD/methylene tetrahydromethanopterin reductase-like flavin-dependent oxidoreductase (luciferase family)
MLTKRHASITALKAAGAEDSHIQKIKELGDIDSISSSVLRNSISPELMNLYTIAGTPEDCQTRIGELVDMGIKHLTLVPFSNEEKNILEVLEIFSDFDCISN